MIEIEQRYRVTDVRKIIATLGEHGIAQTNQSRIIDEWFAPIFVQSHEQQRAWFDGGHGVAYRVRRVEQPDGTFSVKLDSKQLTADGDHNTFKEEVVEEITDYEQAHAFLAEKDYWNWLTIDKTRRMFDSKDPEIDLILDEIEGLAEKIGVGAALEVEYQGEASREEALRKTHEFAAQFGLSTGDMFDKSLTVEAMSELAKFE